MGVLFICVEVPLLCHWQLLLLLHSPLYSLPLQCLKAELRESDLESDWGCNVSPVSWALLAEGQSSEPPGQDRRLTIQHDHTCVERFFPPFLNFFARRRHGILNLVFPLTRVSGECRSINKQTVIRTGKSSRKISDVIKN